MAKRTQNEQTGTTNMTGVSSGDGTKVVTLPNPMGNTTYNVQLTLAESLGAGKRGFLAVTTKTKLSFTITLDSDSTLTDIDIDWKASHTTQ